MFWTLICKKCGKRHLVSYIQGLPPGEKVSAGKIPPIQCFQCDNCRHADNYLLEDLSLSAQGSVERTYEEGADCGMNATSLRPVLILGTNDTWE
jgi:hypothetical protein